MPNWFAPRAPCALRTGDVITLTNRVARLPFRAPFTIATCRYFRSFRREALSTPREANSTPHSPRFPQRARIPRTVTRVHDHQKLGLRETDFVQALAYNGFARIRIPPRVPRVKPDSRRPGNRRPEVVVTGDSRVVGVYISLCFVQFRVPGQGVLGIDRRNVTKAGTVLSQDGWSRKRSECRKHWYGCLWVRP